MRGLGGPQAAQARPRCTKCNSSLINGQCTNHRGTCVLFAAWRPPKKLKNRPAYDIVIPDSGFDGVPFDDEELTPGADEDIQSSWSLPPDLELHQDLDPLHDVELETTRTSSRHCHCRTPFPYQTTLHTSARLPATRTSDIDEPVRHRCVIYANLCVESDPELYQVLNEQVQIPRYNYSYKYQVSK